MIKLEFEIAIFLYLLITIFGILLIWLTGSKIKPPAKNTVDLESIWQCAICTYLYVDSKHPRFSTCPRCQSLNERENKGGVS